MAGKEVDSGNRNLPRKKSHGQVVSLANYTKQLVKNEIDIGVEMSSSLSSLTWKGISLSSSFHFSVGLQLGGGAETTHSWWQWATRQKVPGSVRSKGQSSQRSRAARYLGTVRSERSTPLWFSFESFCYLYPKTMGAYQQPVGAVWWLSMTGPVAQTCWQEKKVAISLEAKGNSVLLPEAFVSTADKIRVKWNDRKL